jgi:hypothetical protein
MSHARVVQVGRPREPLALGGGNRPHTSYIGAFDGPYPFREHGRLIE